MSRASALLRLDFLKPRGAGQTSDVPPFDHALKVNDALDQAATVAHFADPVDLASDGDSLLVADGTTVARLRPTGESSVLLDTGTRVTAIAPVAGGVACAIEGREIRLVGGKFDGACFTGPTGHEFRAVNAMSFDGTTILVTDGSRIHAPGDWRRDLMSKGSTGRVFSIDPVMGTTEQVKSGLRYAFGAVRMNDEVLISESWAHRLVAVGTTGVDRTVGDEFPAYPSRICAAKHGYWLTMSCVRSELVEFVLREQHYRDQMMASIDPHLWIAPQLRSFRHAQEPVQWGAVRQQCVIKPWAPARSYGLVVKLDDAGEAQYSLHSRSGGTAHGLLAAAQLGETLFILSRGQRAVLKLDIAALQKEGWK